MVEAFRISLFDFFLLFLRMTKALTEADGLSWREKLPPIPTVPLSVREKLTQKATATSPQPNPTPQQNGTKQTNKPGEQSCGFCCALYLSCCFLSVIRFVLCT